MGVGVGFGRFGVFVGLVGGWYCCLGDGCCIVGVG